MKYIYEEKYNENYLYFPRYSLDKNILLYNIVKK